MQRDNECVKCGNVFDDRKFKPLKLECDHVMCAQCVKELYRQNDSIPCPWHCEKKTESDPLDLQVVTHLIHLEDKPLNLDECKDHKGQIKMLLCKDDMKTICLVCAQFSKQHQGHQIVDIKEEVSNFKEKEVKQASETAGEIKIAIEQGLQLIQDLKLKNINQIEEVMNKLNCNFEILKTTINEIQNKKNIQLLQEQENCQKYLDNQTKLLQDIDSRLKKAQPQDEENITELLDFIGKVNLIIKQTNKFELKEDDFEYEDQDNLVQEITKQSQNLADYIHKENQINLFKPQWQEELPKTYAIILKGTKTQKLFYLENKNFQSQELNIPAAIHNGWRTYIEQIGEDNLYISGRDKTDNYRNFTIYNKDSYEQLQMIEQRQYHRTVYDLSSGIDFIISGQDQNDKQSKKCETFNSYTKDFRQIADIIDPVKEFGCCFAQSQVLVFGGYGNGGTRDSIQIYNCGNNQWVQHATKFPQKSKAAAAYLKNIETNLVYCNYTIDSLVFDFNNVTRHGEKFIGDVDLYTKPIVLNDTVYQFDYNAVLYSYEMKQAKWEKIQ